MASRSSLLYFVDVDFVNDISFKSNFPDDYILPPDVVSDLDCLKSNNKL